MSNLLVKTLPGQICPCEENPRKHISDDPKGTEVPDSSYYRRLLDDGSLVIVTGKTNSGGEA